MTEIISTSVRTQHSALTATGDRRPPSALIPLPELPITVRLATIDDLMFIDELQKKNSKSLGFMNRPTLEGKIAREEVLIAEEVVSSELPVVSEDAQIGVRGSEFGVRGNQNPNAETRTTNAESKLTTHNSQLATTRVGYLIGNDRYFKRDELGAIFQLCVVPGKRRGLVGATLLKSLFDRASYGCRLYCCWCAQDLEANHFWESMGFVPVAFRTGSKNKNKRLDGQKGARIHIFWQKRIRAGDTETPYWYPHETGGGSIGEDRIVLPIDPRVHWSQVKLEVVPGEENDATGGRSSSTAGLLECADDGQSPETAGEDARPSIKNGDGGPSPSKPKRAKKPAPAIPQPVKSKLPRIGRALMFAPPAPVEVAKTPGEKQPKVKPPKVKKKNDPEKVKAARYIRDRYMEEINRGEHLVSHAKYDVSRLIENVALPDGAVPVDQKLLAA